jgi:hypothetical protein
VAKAEGADPKRASRGALNRATSSRNGERNHLGTPGEIKSEWRATSSRNLEASVRSRDADDATRFERDLIEAGLN